jgi:hemerythrin superfamily protein
MTTSHSNSSLALAAAAGLGAGLAANLARKLMVQAPSALAGDWSEALAAEHRAALAIFDRLEATSQSDERKRKMLLAQLKHAIGKHAFQEENVIYPALRDHGLAPSESELTREHADVKHALFQLTLLPKDDPAWIGEVRALRAAIEPHMQQEENEIFPQLRGRLGEEENQALTRALHKEGLKLA